MSFVNSNYDSINRTIITTIIKKQWNENNDSVTEQKAMGLSSPIEYFWVAIDKCQLVARWIKNYPNKERWNVLSYMATAVTKLYISSKSRGNTNSLQLNLATIQKFLEHF